MDKDNLQVALLGVRWLIFRINGNNISSLLTTMFIVFVVLNLETIQA